MTPVICLARDPLDARYICLRDVNHEPPHEDPTTAPTRRWY